MIELPGRRPEACRLTDTVYVDHSGHDGGVHRAYGTNELCVAVTVLDRGQLTRTYYLPEASEAWQMSETLSLVDELVAQAIGPGKRDG